MTMILYAYEVNRTRARTIDEMGIYNQIHTQEKPPHYNDRSYDEDYTLLGRVSAHDYNDLDALVQIVPGSQLHHAEELFTSTAHFTVLEAATLLQCPEQHIRDRIESHQIKATKRADAWFLCGQDILALSLQEQALDKSRQAS